jgi:hypothetical protein
MKMPAYWRDRDPDLHAQVHRMMQQEVGTGVVTKAKVMGGKGDPL